MRLPDWYFPTNLDKFYDIFQNSFFAEHLWVTAPE